MLCSACATPSFLTEAFCYCTDKKPLIVIRPWYVCFPLMCVRSSPIFEETYTPLALHGASQFCINQVIVQQKMRKAYT